ncbi:MAG: hypothetical protein DRO73_11690 [Candidatus Thorarchaeota archaeon]|nr:MAG: hypothetical protein DRO73_11690 [Candidatus Thorarchaeota archaeon]
MLTSGRTGWLDVAKGLGILFVMTVHSVIPLVNAITVHLSAFAIPLFFVIAGMTHNTDKYRHDLRRLISARGRQLMVPYVILYVLMMALFVPLRPYIDTYLTPDQLLFWFLYGSGPPQSATHLWFLPVLFFGLVLFAALERFAYSLWPPLRFTFIVLLPYGAEVITSLFTPVLVPWHANAVMVAAAFAFIGSELRRLWLLRDTPVQASRTIAVLPLVVTLLLLTSTMNGFTDLAVDNLGANIWLYMASGALGSLSVLIGAYLLSSARSRVCNLLTVFGCHSQVIYEFHPLTFYFVPLFLAVIGFSAESILSSYTSTWPFRLILAVAISLPMTIYVVERHPVLRFVFRGTTTPRFARFSESTGP